MTAAVAAGRFLTVQGMPLLALEAGDELVATVEGHGLVSVPGFFGVDLPRGARLGLTLRQDDLRLEDEQAQGLLRVPRASVDAGWLASARRLRGSMLVVASAIDLDPDLDDEAVCRLLDEAARGGRVVAAIVGFAEPREGLPLLLG